MDWIWERRSLRLRSKAQSSVDEASRNVNGKSWQELMIIALHQYSSESSMLGLLRSTTRFSWV